MWFIIIASLVVLIAAGLTAFYIIGKKTFEDEYPII
jgi:flagellar basal body-associated protein FliL